MHLAEGLSWFDSVYFAMVSISTIGYGDIVPQTNPGKIVAMVYSITGVPLFIYTAGLFVERRLGALVSRYLTDHSEQLADLEDEIDELGEEIEELGEKLKEKKQGGWLKSLGMK